MKKQLNKHVLLSLKTSMFLTIAILVMTVSSLEAKKKNVKFFQDYVKYQDAKTPWKSPLVDWSYSGYHYFNKPTPTVTPKTYIYYDVTKYGAIPNDGKSDHSAVLKAVKAVNTDKSDKPVALFFPPGDYWLYPKFTSTPIVIYRHNTVIKGSGMNDNGTQLVMMQPPKAGCAITVTPYRIGQKNGYWRGDKLMSVIGVSKNKPTQGTFSVKVQNTKKLKVGQVVYLVASITTSKQEDEYYKPLPVAKYHYNDKGNYWWKKELHIIDKIDTSTRTVTFKEPIQFNLDGYSKHRLTAFSHHGSQKVVEEVGIEDLSIRANNLADYEHYRTIPIDKAGGINFYRSKNCWAKNIRTENTSIAAVARNSIAVTIQNIVMEGYRMHLQVSTYTCYGIWVGYPREHHYGTAHHGIGASDSSCNTVLYRWDARGGFEAHQKWPYATLYDVGSGGIQGRGGGGKHKQPQHAEKMTYWNWFQTADQKVKYFDITGQDRYGYIMRPIIIGLSGPGTFELIGPKIQLAIWHQANNRKFVAPTSLFKGQLKHRLGELPKELIQQDKYYESMRRFTRVESPRNTNPTQQFINKGQSVSLSYNLENFAKPQYYKEFQLVGNRQQYIANRGKEVVLDTYTFKRKSNKKTINLKFKPTGKNPFGYWCLQGKLVNKVGDTIYSEPIRLFVDNFAKRINHQVKVVVNANTEQTTTALTDGNEKTLIQLKSIGRQDGRNSDKMNFDLGAKKIVDIVEIDWIVPNSGTMVTVEIYYSKTSSSMQNHYNNQQGDWIHITMDKKHPVTPEYAIPRIEARYFRIEISRNGSSNGIKEVRFMQVPGLKY